MKIRELFEFDQDAVSMQYIFQWIKAKFSAVISFAHGFAAKVYYLSDLESWDQRIRINDDESLRSNLMQVSNDVSQQSYIMVSIEQESPTKPACDVNASSKQSSAVSSLTDHSSDSAQDNFHQRVLKRDGCCVFCGDCVPAHLFVAHIFDVCPATGIPGEDVEFLQQYGITDLYETDNGITLCGECYDVFNALLCCVKVEFDSAGVVIGHTIVVANALTSSAKFADKWSKLDGASVRVPTNPLLLKYWPPAELFEFRKSKLDEYAEKCLRLSEDLPNICKCGKRNMSAAGLANHMRYRSRLEWMTTKSNKLSELFTPAKSSSVKKKRTNRAKRAAAGKALFSAESK